jgi:hypothetical protein
LDRLKDEAELDGTPITQGELAKLFGRWKPFSVDEFCIRADILVRSSEETVPRPEDESAVDDPLRQTALMAVAKARRFARGFGNSDPYINTAFSLAELLSSAKCHVTIREPSPRTTGLPFRSSAL